MKTLKILINYVCCRLRGEEHRMVRCPVCGHLTMDMGWICPECFFEYDQCDVDNPDEDCGGPNGMSLNEYRAEYLKK